MQNWIYFKLHQIYKYSVKELSNIKSFNAIKLGEIIDLAKFISNFINL